MFDVKENDIWDLPTFYTFVWASGVVVLFISLNFGPLNQDPRYLILNQVC